MRLPLSIFKFKDIRIERYGKLLWMTCRFLDGNGTGKVTRESLEKRLTSKGASRYVIDKLWKRGSLDASLFRVDGSTLYYKSAHSLDFAFIDADWYQLKAIRAIVDSCSIKEFTLFATAIVAGAPTKCADPSKSRSRSLRTIAGRTGSKYKVTAHRRIKKASKNNYVGSTGRHADGFRITSSYSTLVNYRYDRFTTLKPSPRSEACGSGAPRCKVVGLYRVDSSNRISKNTLVRNSESMEYFNSVMSKFCNDSFSYAF